MKKLKFALIFFFIIIIFCIFNFKYVVNKTTEIEQKIDMVQILETEKAGDELFESWEEISKSFAMFIHHDTLDRISKGVSKVRAALKYGDKAYAYEESEGVRILIKVLKESDDINLRNIL